MSTPTRPPSAPQWARVERQSTPPAEAQRPAPSKAPRAKATPSKAPAKKAQAKKPLSKSPSARPAAPKPARRSRRATKSATRAPQPPQRRAETALTETAKSTLSALQVALEPREIHDGAAARAAQGRARGGAQARRREGAGRSCGGGGSATCCWSPRRVWLVLLSPVFALDPAKVAGLGLRHRCGSRLR